MQAGFSSALAVSLGKYLNYQRDGGCDCYTQNCPEPTRLFRKSVIGRIVTAHHPSHQSGLLLSARRPLCGQAARWALDLFEDEDVRSETRGRILSDIPCLPRCRFEDAFVINDWSHANRGYVSAFRENDYIAREVGYHGWMADRLDGARLHPVNCPYDVAHAIRYLHAELSDQQSILKPAHKLLKQNLSSILKVPGL